jgi:cell volume regulation protein A
MSFALTTLVIALAGLAIILSNRLTERLKVPVPVLTLVAAAIAVKVVPGLHMPSEQAVERFVTVSLVCILFAGGMHIGRKRFRAAAMPIVLVGVLRRFFTAGGQYLHWLFG